MRLGRVPLRRFINRLIDRPPMRVPGTAVFLSSTPDATPGALLTNFEHNQIVHERVVLLTLKTLGVPSVELEQRLTVEELRIGFVQITARFGYQETPDVPAVLELARRQGLAIDLDDVSYYVNHVTLIPTEDRAMAGWRKKLFVALYKNSTPGRPLLPHPARPRGRGRRLRADLIR